MPNNKFFRVGKKPISAVQFGEILTEELERQQEELLENIKNFYVAKLEELLDNLRDNSAERGVGFLAVRYNNPFEDAKVIARRTSKGWRIRVDNDMFNWLDEGRPERKAKATMKFPIYTQPTATQGVSIGQPGDLHISAPAHIVALDGPAIVSMQSLRKAAPKELDSFIDTTDTLNQRWATILKGSTLAKRKPRNYYLAIKKIIDAQLARGSVPGARNRINPLLIKTIIERR